MKPKQLLSLAPLVVAANIASAEIGIISPADAKKLIENPDPKKRPIVLDTRGGYICRTTSPKRCSFAPVWARLAPISFMPRGMSCPMMKS
jgi:hypothetical protein